MKNCLNCRKKGTDKCYLKIPSIFEEEWKLKGEKCIQFEPRKEEY